MTQRVAQREGVSADLLDQITLTYFRYVSEQLSSARVARLDLPGLGVFSVKPKKLATKIAKTRCLVEALDSSAPTMQKHLQSREKRKDLALLQDLLKHLDSERARRTTLKNTRHELD